MASQKLFQSNLDGTKFLNFDIDNLSTATTRTALWPDRDVDIGALATEDFVTSVFNAGAWKSSVKACEENNLASLSGTPVLDGYQTVVGDRVLLRGQTNAAENGIYVVDSGAWSRAADADTEAEFANGCAVYCLEGNDAGYGHLMIGAPPATLGTDPINFTTFVSSTAPVISVFGRGGEVVAVAGDYTAAQITNVPAGDIVATDVQGAIDELDAEKLSLALAASNNNGEGASLIGIEDAGGLYTATDVEGALVEVKTLADANEDNISDLALALGVNVGDTDMGGGFGTIITPNQSAKDALIEIESVLENLTSAEGLYTKRAEQSADASIVANSEYPVNVSGGSVTLTLPDSTTLSDGDFIMLLDARQAVSDTNNIILAPFGSDNINGANSNVAFDKQGVRIIVEWDASASSWIAVGQLKEYTVYEGQPGVIEINGEVIELKDDLTAKTPAANAAIDWDVTADGLGLEITLNGTHTLNAPTNLPAAGDYRSAVIKINKTNPTDELNLDAFYSGSLYLGQGTDPVMVSVLVENASAEVRGESMPATEVELGVVRRATQAEVNSGTEGLAYVTPESIFNATWIVKDSGSTYLAPTNVTDVRGVAMDADDVTLQELSDYVAVIIEDLRTSGLVS